MAFGQVGQLSQQQGQALLAAIQQQTQFEAGMQQKQQMFQQQLLEQIRARQARDKLLRRQQNIGLGMAGASAAGAGLGGIAQAQALKEIMNAGTGGGLDELMAGTAGGFLTPGGAGGLHTAGTNLLPWKQ